MGGGAAKLAQVTALRGCIIHGSDKLGPCGGKTSIVVPSNEMPKPLFREWLVPQQDLWSIMFALGTNLPSWSLS